MSLRKNIYYNVLLTCSLYVLQFLTYPYVSRVLGVQGMGAVNFAQSLVQYFMMFCMLGVSVVGMREMAKAGTDQAQRDRVFSAIFMLNMGLTAIVLMAYLAALWLVPKLHAYAFLLGLGAFQLLFNTLSVEWLYKGLEEFRFISLRTLGIRLLYVVLVFVLVRDACDVGLYFGLSVGVVVVGGGINFFYSRRFVRLCRVSWHTMLPYVRPLGMLGLYSLMTMMYTTFNVVFLGFVSNDYEVGLYGTAVRLHGIIIGLFTAFTTVLMSRISALRAERDAQAIDVLLGRSFDLLCVFVLPLTVGMLLFAPEIILLVSGAGYEAAVPLLRVVLPLVFVIGLEQVLVNQVLMPFDGDGAVLRASFFGAFVGLVLNVALVPFFAGLGSSLVWLASELAVLCVAWRAARGVVVLSFGIRRLLAYVFLSVLPLVVMLGLRFWCDALYVAFSAWFLFVIYWCFVLRFVLRNTFFIALLRRFRMMGVDLMEFKRR